MELRIQYATTEDGMRIAFWTMGEGPPLVFMRSEYHSHIGVERTIPELQALYEHLANGRTLIRYDSRGCGLSTRDAQDYSVEALARDLAAVMDASGNPSANAVTLGNAIFPALSLMSTQPGRVRRLAAIGGWRSGLLSRRRPLLDVLEPVIEDFWEDYTQIQAHLMVGWSNGDIANRLAVIYREAIDPKHARETRARDLAFDPAALLARVRAPCLMLSPDTTVAARMAQLIQGGEVAIVPAPLGNYILQWRDYADGFLPFLDDAEDAKAEGPRKRIEGLVTVLFTDLTSSTALTQSLGDAKAQDLVRAHNAIVRQALAACGGAEIKHTGDGIMASFPTASGALECAVAIQRGVSARADANLQVHIGLNAGEPIAEEQDLFGTAVQLARRVCDQAEGGEILASDVVRQLAAGKDFLFSDRGEVALRGFEDPVRLYEVRWREET